MTFRASTLTIFAATLVGCATSATADLDQLDRSVMEAMNAGDYDRALQLVEQVGELAPTEGEGSTGYFDATFALSAEDPTGGSSVMDGTLVGLGGANETDFEGRWMPTPEGDRGIFMGATIAPDGTVVGRVFGSFREGDGMADTGPYRATWILNEQRGIGHMSGSWTETVAGEGVLSGDFDFTPPPAWGTGMRVRVQVDGRSNLTIDPNQAFFQHLEGSAPGTWGLDAEEGNGEGRATVINGAAWWPSWPDAGENIDCSCASDAFTVSEEGAVMVPEAAVDVTLTEYEGRGGITILQYPDVSNDYRMVIEIDDRARAGAAWYEFQVDYAAL